MFNGYTVPARKVMYLARSEAIKLNHEFIDTEHILLGLVEEGSGLGASVLRNIGLNSGTVRREVEQTVETGTHEVLTGQLPFTRRAKRVLELAVEESTLSGHNYFGTEHLLLGLMREDEGKAAHVLLNFGLTIDEVKEEIKKETARLGREKTAGG